MSSTDPPPAPPSTWALTAIGPGLLVAAAGIGAGDIVSSTMAASRHGLALVWVVVLAAGLKGVLNIIRTFTIVGSLFIPFLSGTLLYLNNVKLPAESGVPRNTRFNNAVLVLALVVFAAVGLAEAGLLRR